MPILSHSNKTRYSTSWVQCPQLIPGFIANKTGEMLLVDSGRLRLLFRPRIHERKKIKHPIDLDISDLKDVRTWHRQCQVMVSRRL